MFFIDSDVYFDFLLQRTPFHLYANEIFDLIGDGIIESLFAPQPHFERSEWSYAAKEHAKPYQFSGESLYSGVCPDVDDVRLFAEFLLTNPSARANIVIRDPSKKQIERKQKSVLKNLTKVHGISSSRIRFFGVREKPTGMLPPLEYWFLP